IADNLPGGFELFDFGSRWVLESFALESKVLNEIYQSLIPTVKADITLQSRNFGLQLEWTASSGATLRVKLLGVEREFELGHKEESVNGEILNALKNFYGGWNGLVSRFYP